MKSAVVKKPVTPSRPSVIIVAHGSTLSADAHEAATQHALTLRQSHRYGTVGTCFLATQKDAAPPLPEGEVFLLPFFMSDGYFVKTRLPELFGLEKGVRIEPARQLYQCEALGVDPELAEIIVAMAGEICRKEDYRPSDIELVLVAHGSEKSGASAAAARLQQAAVDRAGIFAGVSTAFLSEAPLLPDWLAARAHENRPLILVGLFAAEGPHSAEDVPGALDAWREAFAPRCQAHYAGAIGVRPEIVKLIQHSISRCAAGTMGQGR